MQHRPAGAHWLQTKAQANLQGIYTDMQRQAAALEAALRRALAASQPWTSTGASRSLATLAAAVHCRSGCASSLARPGGAAPQWAGLQGSPQATPLWQRQLARLMSRAAEGKGDLAACWHCRRRHRRRRPAAAAAAQRPPAHPVLCLPCLQHCLLGSLYSAVIRQRHAPAFTPASATSSLCRECGCHGGRARHAQAQNPKILCAVHDLR